MLPILCLSAYAILFFLVNPLLKNFAILPFNFFLIFLYLFFFKYFSQFTRQRTNTAEEARRSVYFFFIPIDLVGNLALGTNSKIKKSSEIVYISSFQFLFDSYGIEFVLNYIWRFIPIVYTTLRNYRIKINLLWCDNGGKCIAYHFICLNLVRFLFVCFLINLIISAAIEMIENYLYFHHHHQQSSFWKIIIIGIYITLLLNIGSS